MNVWQREQEREERRDRCISLQSGGDTDASRFDVEQRHPTPEFDAALAAQQSEALAKVLQRRQEAADLTDAEKDRVLARSGAIHIPHFIEQPCVRCGCRRRYAAFPDRCLFCEAIN